MKVEKGSLNKGLFISKHYLKDDIFFMELKCQSIPKNLSFLYSETKKFTLNWLKNRFPYHINSVSILIYGSLGQTIFHPDYHFFDETPGDVDLLVFCKTLSKISKNRGSTQKMD